MTNTDKRPTQLKNTLAKLMDNRIVLSLACLLVGGVMAYLSWDLYEEITAKEALNHEVKLHKHLQFFYHIFGKWGVVSITGLTALFLWGVAIYCLFVGDISDKPVDIEEVTTESAVWKKIIFLWMGPPLLAWGLYVIKAIVAGNLSLNYAMYLVLGAALGAIVGIAGGKADEKYSLAVLVCVTSYIGTTIVWAVYFS
ncbi:hypothetical protein [Gimesia fumaroli]|uniref:Uncharacterized protein n=1 Tax=Gimesia fumaroli TaxID=2527976 RepID=A0A518ID57_9PLAN|nr:hypothetical protein [Gimesia fumaroli]QDV51008.1 hypothetical protein Enr17x_30600 [Gimesia fumaroli]